MLTNAFFCLFLCTALPAAPSGLEVLSMVDGNLTLSWQPGFNGHSALLHCNLQVGATFTSTHTHTPAYLFLMCLCLRFLPFHLLHGALLPHPSTFALPAVAPVRPQVGAPAAGDASAPLLACGVRPEEPLQLQYPSVMCQRSGGVALFTLAALSDTRIR